MPRKITSLTNKIWNIHSEWTSDSIVTLLAQNRGIRDIDAFTKISVRDTMPDPFVFTDMKKAARRIALAIESGQKIAILGDYDVDGISSVSIFIKLLTHVGADYTYFIPNRTDDGYGLSVSNLEKHKDYLVIAVDCGSNAITELQYAKNNNIEVVVIDHHQMSTIFPDTIIVNPHRSDESCGYQYLCAAALCFICVTAINRELREAGFYKRKMIKEPSLINYLDLVALATVCDVVDLVGLNRAFVTAGLKVIRLRKNLGIDALLATNKGNVINSETIAFFLGPKLNASGRMASADISVKLLTTDNPIEARKIAAQLDELNKERQNYEREIIGEAELFVKENQNFVCAYSDEWHMGIIGIIAGRLREKHNRPSIVITRDSLGMGKASCRSVEHVDISAVIKKGIAQGIIISGGGHALAAGFSIDMSRVEDLIKFLESEITHRSEAAELQADCVIPLQKVSVDFIKSMEVLEPFGKSNPAPRFVISNVSIANVKVIGENHMSFSLCDKNGNVVKGVSFRCLETPLGDLLRAPPDSVNVLGALTISSWNGREYIRFMLEDIASAF